MVRQGVDTAADNEITMKFHTLAAHSSWNHLTLKAVFREGLKTSPQAELAKG